MPTVDFVLRWPDGHRQRGQSPSRAIERALAPGASYPEAELLRRCEGALAEGSERVRAKHGFGCTAAAAQADALREAARRHGSGPAGLVHVEHLRRGPTRARFPAPDRLPEEVPVVVVGGGQAGLSASWHLGERAVEHLVLERDRVGRSWREERWDAFCLVTPNWQCRLPGWPYAGSDPDGFMVREEVVEYVEAFAGSFDPPLVEGCGVQGIESAGDGRFLVRTALGDVLAEQVVLAVGAYHLPAVPALAQTLPAAVSSVHSARYRSPQALPDGAVLVVGSGQSGAQIVEDLHLAGREVHLAVGSAPRVARFHRGRDVVAWLEDMGHYDLAIEDHPEGLAARREANHYVTGRDGGHDLDLRAFARQGVRLHGRLREASGDGGVLRFAGDLRASLDAADATYARINAAIDRWIAARGIAAPPGHPYRPVWEPGPGADAGSELDLQAAGVRTVVWATGFRSDWSWVRLAAFDEAGYPTHRRGITTVPGLYVLGLPWLHTWGSARFAGIARDAEHVADAVASRTRARTAPG